MNVASLSILMSDLIIRLNLFSHNNFELGIELDFILQYFTFSSSSSPAYDHHETRRDAILSR